MNKLRVKISHKVNLFIVQINSVKFLLFIFILNKAKTKFDPHNKDGVLPP